MELQAEGGPVGVRAVDGVVHKRSSVSVAETVLRLTSAIRAAGATVFFVVDHSGEAERAGLSLRDTKLVGFGNPAGGTPAMVASPLAALDLPLKVLVWIDEDGAVWMSYVDPPWLAARHGLDEDLAAPLSAVDQLTTQVTAAENQEP
ncbi:MAG TPA: DUF302 domain-containing protein [Kribbella sp.]|nr:DUF302 domain-containing protein [Kribbella sp.]